MTLARYIDSVNLWIHKFTDGEIDLNDLADFADGEASISECHADEIPARECAGRILCENGMDELVPADILREYWLGDLNDTDDSLIGG